MALRIGMGRGLCLLAVILLGCVGEHPAYAAIGDLTADGVIGQSSFTDGLALAIGPGTFGKPSGLAVDATRKRVYVSDSVNHRVLGWSDTDALVDGASADLVIGQPDFASYGCNRSLDGSKQPVTLESLCGPSGLAVDTARASVARIAKPRSGSSASRTRSPPLATAAG